MQEFLVTTELQVPAGQFEPEERARLYAEERQRGIELHRQGAIERIWRIPGAPYRTVSIRKAPDAASLQADLESLPLFDFLRIEVTALAAHPIEAEAELG